MSKREAAENKFYTYPVRDVRKVIDGDTVKMEIDLGFRLTFTENFRLARINAPEVRGPERPEGLKSKTFLEELLAEAKEIWLESYKHGKYRWIAELYVDGKSVSDLLVEAGHAEYVDYD